MNDENLAAPLSVGGRVFPAHKTGMSDAFARQLRQCAHGLAVAITVCLGAVAVSGCGQKGPLKLPGAERASSSVAAPASSP